MHRSTNANIVYAVLPATVFYCLLLCQFSLRGPFVPVPNSQQPLMIVQASRHLMEHTLRGLVTQNPRIQTTYGSHVKGLSFSNSGGSSKNSRVVGVKLADGQVVPADLAVIANGRRSDISAWLKAEGWPKAPVSTTSTNIRYVNW